MILFILSAFLMTGLAFSASQTGTSTTTTGTTSTTSKKGTTGTTDTKGTPTGATDTSKKTALSVDKSDTINKAAETASQFISDSTITAKIKTELLASKNISSLSISVATDKGVVTLSGTVESLPQKEEVVKITSHVSGVKSVIDQLTINRI